MSKPKAPKESAESKAARLAEEERIRVAQARASADEAAAGRQLLTRKTRMTMRLFGARSALAGFGGSGGSPSLGDLMGASGSRLGGTGGFTGGTGFSLGGAPAVSDGDSGRFLGGGWVR